MAIVSIDRRFNDSHLRRYPELIPLAVRYVRDYSGEFEPLVEAAELVAATGTLPLAVARRTLNCMRSDAECAVWLDEWLGELLDEDPTPQAPRRRKTQPPEDEEPKRPALIKTKVILKTNLLLPRGGGPHRKIHKVVDAWCEWQIPFEWDSSTRSYIYPAERIPKLCLRVAHDEQKINAHYGYGFHSSYSRAFLLTPDDPRLTEFQNCTKCWDLDTDTQEES